MHIQGIALPEVDIGGKILKHVMFGAVLPGQAMYGQMFMVCDHNDVLLARILFDELQRFRYHKRVEIVHPEDIVRFAGQGQPQICSQHICTTDSIGSR
jgi:hypothetical protein